MSKIKHRGPEWFLWHEKLVRYRDKETVFFEGLTRGWNDKHLFYAMNLRFETFGLGVVELEHSILRCMFGGKVWLEAPLLNYAGGAPRTLSPTRQPVIIKPNDVFEIHILWNADGAKPKRRPPAKVAAIIGGRWGTTRLY